MSQKTHAGENALTMLVQLVKTALKGKVDAEPGKGLSTSDYTPAEKAKLAAVAEGANRTTVEDVLTSDSRVNALSAAQGKVLDGKIKEMKDSLGALGYGDMLKLTYDADNDGVIDKESSSITTQKQIRPTPTSWADRPRAITPRPPACPPRCPR